VPGQRDGETCKRPIRQVRDRTGGRADVLLTSHEHAPYGTAIREAYGVETSRPRRPGPGRPPQPAKVVPAELCYANVRKRREKGWLAEVVRTLVELVHSLDLDAWESPVARMRDAACGVVAGLVGDHPVGFARSMIRLTCMKYQGLPESVVWPSALSHSTI
jgi:hypothetical protein